MSEACPGVQALSRPGKGFKRMMTISKSGRMSRRPLTPGSGWQEGCFRFLGHDAFSRRTGDGTIASPGKMVENNTGLDDDEPRNYRIDGKNVIPQN